MNQINRIKKFVHEHPIASAFVVGAVVGSAIGRHYGTDEYEYVIKSIKLGVDRKQLEQMLKEPGKIHWDGPELHGTTVDLYLNR